MLGIAASIMGGHADERSRLVSIQGVPEPALAALLSASECRFLHSQGGETPFWVLEFDEAQFTGAEFELSCVPCPDAIARSVRRRQAEFFFGRLAARLAVQGVSGRVADIPIGPHRRPVWPAGISGSISHADGIAVAAAVQSEPPFAIGIDVERLSPALDVGALADLIAAPSELEILSSQRDGWSRQLQLTLLFSAKEAIYKAYSTSVPAMDDFRDLHLVSIGGSPDTLDFALRPDIIVSHAFPRKLSAEFRVADSLVLTVSRANAKAPRL